MLQFSRQDHALRVEGELTIYHAAEARTRLREALGTEPSLELNLSGVEEMDTAGAQVLLWLKREAAAEGRGVHFTHHSAAVLEVIDLLNLASVYGDTLVIAPAP